MRAHGSVPYVVIVAAALALLGASGAWWPTWAQAEPSSPALAPGATIRDAITYQGYLTDPEDEPLSGSFAMRFAIYNDAAAGDLLWTSQDLRVAVSDGLFEARLAIPIDIFNGEELWVEQTVNGETLRPRQEILPAPMAHTLRPGAIVKGTANAIPNNYLLDVQMNNDASAFNRGAIHGQSTTGNAIYGLADNGRAVYGQTRDGYAIYGFDGGSDANRGYAGYFYSTNGVGVYGYSNGDRSHPNILAPGVYGQSNRGVGVYGRGDTSDSSSFYNEGGYFEGGKGLFARGSDPPAQQGYGARFYSDSYRGIFVRGGTSHFDAYFGGDGGVSAASYVDRAGNRQSLAYNAGDTAIEPGDLVAMAGVVPGPGGEPPMLAVAKLDGGNRNAVIGVAKEAVARRVVVFEDGSEHVDFQPGAGAIAPQGHLVLITEGLAPAVNVAGLRELASSHHELAPGHPAVEGADVVARAATWRVGDKVAVVAGPMVRAGDVADGTAPRVVEDIVVGRVAGPIDPVAHTIPLFIDID